MFNLSGKIALVTGASGTIGSAIARSLYQLGATLALSGTKSDSLEKLKQEFGKMTEIFPCDLSKDSDVDNLIPEVEKKFGTIDILVNNAGINRDNLLLRISDEDWHDVIKVNLDAPFKLMRSVSKIMIKAKRGRIINISSIVGAVGNPGQANYSASKSGLFGLTKTAAAELASRNITVNCIAPGFIESPMTDRIPETAKQTLVQKIPAKRIGSPEEVAAAVAFLASDEASYITGHVLHVNGGMAMI